MNAIICLYNKSFIGIDNKMPWEIISKLRGNSAVIRDMRIFQKYTSGKIVAMGYNTWQSLNFKPLKGRKTHIIITHKNIIQSERDKENNVFYYNLEDFISKYKDNNDVWVIGGIGILLQVIKYCNLCVVNNINFPYEWLIGINQNRITYARSIISEIKKLNYNKQICVSEENLTIQHYYKDNAKDLIFDEFKVSNNHDI